MPAPFNVFAPLCLLAGLSIGVCGGCDALSPGTQVPQALNWTDTEGARHEATLPHRIDGATRRAGGTVRYEATFDAAAWPDDAPLGVVVLADMHVSGVQWPMSLMSMSPTTRPLPNHWNRPLLFVASPPLASDATMTLEIETPAGGHGGLRWIRAGPLTAMQQWYRRLGIVLVTTAELSTAAAALFALLMLWVWVAARQNRLYLDFALVCALFALNNLNYHVFDPPLPYAAWDTLVNVALDAFVVALYLFARRLVNRPASVVNRVAVLYVAVAVVLPLLVPAAHRVDTHDALHFISFLWGVASLVLLIRYRRALSPVSAAAFIAAGVILSVIGLHDLLLLKGYAEGAGVPLIHLGAILLVITAFAALIGDLVRVLQLEKTLTQTLERRVAEKTQALQHTHRALVDEEKARAMSEERERLSRELHDGTAGQLMTLLAMLENTDMSLGDKPPGDEDAVSAATTAPPLSAYVRQVIDDLRLTIQSIDPTVETLGELLGTLRPYLETQVQASGARLQWSIGDVPEAPLSSEILHGVQRIVQEAVTNVVRHAQATEVVVRAQPHQGGATIAIADDGCGIAADVVLGRGTGNMRTRAAAMNASLDIAPGGAGGTTLTLHIPAVAFGADTHADEADAAAENP